MIFVAIQCQPAMIVTSKGCAVTCFNKYILPRITMLEIMGQDQINSPQNLSCPFWYNMIVAFLRDLACSTRHVNGKARNSQIITLLSKEFQQ